jgi:hypothetical protein
MSVPAKDDIDEDKTVGQKLWFKPTDLAKYTTYIDHNCELDEQGYPLLPNGNTIFVRLPEEYIINFGTVGFAKTINSETKKMWKIVQTKCLGVMQCDDVNCQWVGPSPTGWKSIDQYLER